MLASRVVVVKALEVNLGLNVRVGGLDLHPIIVSGHSWTTEASSTHTAEMPFPAVTWATEFRVRPDPLLALDKTLGHATESLLESPCSYCMLPCEPCEQCMAWQVPVLGINDGAQRSTLRSAQQSEYETALLQSGHCWLQPLRVEPHSFR
jgi:hypothetical protein